MIIRPRHIEGELVVVYIWCPGCGYAHGFPLSKRYYEGSSIYGPEHHKPIWTFNGNLDRPSITPSLRCFYTHPETKQEITTCHLILTDGVINFCSDCQHVLAGKSIHLATFPEDYGLPFSDK